MDPKPVQVDDSGGSGVIGFIERQLVAVEEVQHGVL